MEQRAISGADINYDRQVFGLREADKNLAKAEGRRLVEQRQDQSGGFFGKTGNGHLGAFAGLTNRTVNAVCREGVEWMGTVWHIMPT